MNVFLLKSLPRLLWPDKDLKDLVEIHLWYVASIVDIQHSYASLVCYPFITDMCLYWFTLNLHIKTVSKRGVDLCLYRLKRRRGEAQNSKCFACFNHKSTSYFSSNLELDLILVYFSLKIELDLRLQLQLNYTLVRK